MILQLDGIGTGGNHIIQLKADLEILCVFGSVVQGGIASTAVPWEQTISSRCHELGAGLLLPFQIVTNSYNSCSGSIVDPEIGIIGGFTGSSSIGGPECLILAGVVLITIAIAIIAGNICIITVKVKEQVIGLRSLLKRSNINVVE